MADSKSEDTAQLIECLWPYVMQLLEFSLAECSELLEPPVTGRDARAPRRPGELNGQVTCSLSLLHGFHGDPGTGYAYETGGCTTSKSLPYRSSNTKSLPQGLTFTSV